MSKFNDVDLKIRIIIIKLLGTLSVDDDMQTLLYCSPHTIGSYIIYRPIGSNIHRTVSPESKTTKK